MLFVHKYMLYLYALRKCICVSCCKFFQWIPFFHSFSFLFHILFTPHAEGLIFFFTEDSFVSMFGDKMHFLKSTFKFFALSSIIHTCHVMLTLSPLCIIHQHRRKGDMHLKKTVTFFISFGKTQETILIEILIGIQVIFRSLLKK